VRTQRTCTCEEQKANKTAPSATRAQMSNQAVCKMGKIVGVHRRKQDEAKTTLHEGKSVSRS
jgi:hypothetical protein